MKTKKYNPSLKFIRDDIDGNLMIDGEYVFGTEKNKLPINRLLKWISSKNPQKSEKKKDTFKPEVITNSNFVQTNEDKIVWLGHSSFYIQLNSVRILTDPVFYDLTPFLRRRHGMPCSVEDLKPIDYILLSHGHRDHLDLASLKSILQFNPDVEILCPLGFLRMLRSLGFKNVHEAAWWQQYNLEALDITFLPSKHWNRRLITDYNTTLWGSFSIKSNSRTVYFAGDTGYSSHFNEINRHFPHFDVCLMPVGAYKPKYVMEWAHTSPEEAVQGFHDLKGKTFIPMHYGTFDLSDEPPFEPLKILDELHKNEGLNGKLEVLKVGQEFRFTI